MSRRWTHLPGEKPAKKANKYHAEKVVVDGHTFDSKLEAARYGELKLLQHAGVISTLELQPKFKLACGERPVLIKSKGYPNGRQATYRADFRYHDNERDRQVVEDAKGHDTPGSRLRRAIVEAQFNVEIVIIRGKPHGNVRNRRKN